MQNKNLELYLMSSLASNMWNTSDNLFATLANVRQKNSAPCGDCFGVLELAVFTGRTMSVKPKSTISYFRYKTKICRSKFNDFKYKLLN